ncbi:multidrug ABC transporter ATP-binding protein [Actinomycetes bacterium]|nr:multidrug ABC transporter ATP-binding protein [Actinomycetes bacterium]
MKFFKHKYPKPVDEKRLPASAYPPPPEDAARIEKGFGMERAANRLPIATERTVNREMWSLLLANKNGFIWVAIFQLFTTIAALIPPRAFGNLLERLKTDPQNVVLSKTIIIVITALIIQTLLVYLTKVRASILGEFVLSSLRERFIERAVQLPPNVVERAGSGELLTRTTTDIDKVTWAVRDAVPIITICLVQILGISVAIAFTAPIFFAAIFIGIPFLFAGTRWYLRRSPQAYRVESSSYAIVNSVLIETAESGRTIDALRLGEERSLRTHATISRWLQWERYTLRLRTRWFPLVETNYIIPVSTVLLMGSYLYHDNKISIALITSGLLYAQMLANPIERMLWWIDELQTGKASLSRLLGIYEIEEREIRSATPKGEEISGENVTYGYREGRDVLKDISFLVEPGTKLAIVGPSGAGKSTLGRLLAGVQPPNHGKITVGGAEIGYLPVEQARTEVALVTQEHHVFVGTLKENVTLARPNATDAEVWRALAAVDATEWAKNLPEELATVLGTGGHRLLPAQAQQLALARLVLADPHTLILDEATSLLDQKAAKHLEASLGAVLSGRTVIAIAHRLQSAHDADLIAVIEDGEITEWGSHDNLLKANGAYAKLWRSWRDEN